jgi:hypothetical protein
MTSRSTIAGDVLELLPNALRRIDREF